MTASQKLNKRRGKDRPQRQRKETLELIVTYQFVLLQVQSLQFAASFRQSNHAIVGDTVALTQMDVLKLATLLP